MGRLRYDGGVGIPFALRRPVLLVRDMVVDRDHPDLERLASIEDPERFVWAILPHAARTFAPCITLLPKRASRAAAVAYLYCRMLDTYEDLVVQPAKRDAALAAFAGRLDAATPDGVPAPPPIRESAARDARDAAHLLLVQQHALVDRVYLTLEPEVRALIRTLVREMAEGMRWSSAAFEHQGGVLESEEQLARYCRNVIGQPVLFASRLLRWHETGGGTALPDAVAEDAMTVGEMIQLANVTRDIEKDLLRGIAYDPRLRNDLGCAVDGDPTLAERIRSVRGDLLVMALSRASSYRRLIEGLSPRRISLARASGVLMLLFTDRYYRACARRAGRPTWGRHRSGARLVLTALPAAWSRGWTRRVISEVERNFLRAAGGA
jgi:phytoene/squalene synthetase